MTARPLALANTPPRMLRRRGERSGQKVESSVLQNLVSKHIQTKAADTPLTLLWVGHIAALFGSSLSG